MIRGTASEALGDEAAQRPDESVEHRRAPESRQLE